MNRCCLKRVDFLKLKDGEKVNFSVVKNQKWIDTKIGEKVYATLGYTHLFKAGSVSTAIVVDKIEKKETFLLVLELVKD